MRREIQLYELEITNKEQIAVVSKEARIKDVIVSNKSILLVLSTPCIDSGETENRKFILLEPGDIYSSSVWTIIKTILIGGRIFLLAKKWK